MFGECAVYINGKVVALVCDNSVFVKPTKVLQHLGASLGEGPPYPGATPYLLADALLDDPGMLRQVLLKTAAEVRAPQGTNGSLKGTFEVRRFRWRIDTWLREDK